MSPSGQLETFAGGAAHVRSWGYSRRNRGESGLADAMAAFEAEGEDRENDLCDEPPEDDEPSVTAAAWG